MWTRIRHTWSNHPTLDWAFGLALTAVYWFLPELLDSTRSLSALDQPTRQVLYQTLAGISGALLGFVIAAVSILLALGRGPRMRFVLESPWAPLIPATFFAAVRELALATVIFVLGIVYDTTPQPPWMWQVLAVFAAILVTLRMARTAWLLRQLVSLTYQDSGKQAGPSPPSGSGAGPAHEV
jgi:hypothetical protein